MSRMLAILAALVGCTTYHATIRVTRDRGYPAIHQFVSDGESIPLNLGVCGPDVARIDEHGDRSSFHVQVSCVHAGLPDPDASEPILLR